jgi:hypothetical protein
MYLSPRRVAQGEVQREATVEWWAQKVGPGLAARRGPTVRHERPVAPEERFRVAFALADLAGWHQAKAGSQVVVRPPAVRAEEQREAVLAEVVRPSAVLFSAAPQALSLLAARLGQ